MDTNKHEFCLTGIDTMNRIRKYPAYPVNPVKNLIISPVHDKDRDKKFRAALVKINKKHEKTLKKLKD